MKHLHNKMQEFHLDNGIRVFIKPINMEDSLVYWIETHKNGSIVGDLYKPISKNNVYEIRGFIKRHINMLNKDGSNAKKT